MFNIQFVYRNHTPSFGSVMTGRAYAAGIYRFGFNGKENDDEVKGVGNQQDYGFRISDTRIGRFLSIDPLSLKYPELTPYQFAGNTPIWASDIDGLEARIKTIYTNNKGKTCIDIKNAKDYTWSEWKAIKSAMFAGFGWTEKSPGFEWSKGFKNYNYRKLKANDPSGYDGPEGGVLTIDSRGSITKLSFEYELGSASPKGPKPATMKESIKMGWEGFKMIWKDEGVTEVRNNILSGFSLIIGLGELQKGIEFWKAAGVLSDVDDLLKASENIKNNDLKVFINSFKLIIDYKGIQGTSIEGMLNKKLSKEQISQLGLDAESFTQSLESLQNSVQEGQEEKCDPSTSKTLPTN